VLPIPATAQLFATTQILPHLADAQLLPPHATASLLAAVASFSAVLPAVLR
jgi:hypothetical protein